MHALRFITPKGIVRGRQSRCGLCWPLLLTTMRSSRTESIVCPCRAAVRARSVTNRSRLDATGAHTHKTCSLRPVSPPSSDHI